MASHVTALHVGFLLSQFPDEVQWRRLEPISSNPSSQAKAQVVFHGKFPELSRQSTVPLAGFVSALHSTTLQAGRGALQSPAEVHRVASVLLGMKPFSQRTEHEEL